MRLYPLGTVITTPAGNRWTLTATGRASYPQTCRDCRRPLKPGVHAAWKLQNTMSKVCQDCAPAGTATEPNGQTSTVTIGSAR